MQLQSWMKMALICVAIAQMCKAVENSSLRDNHKISVLPGQPPVSFQQYAGYITIGEEPQRALFYYFVEAETDPISKPLVLWLNGGPGCSSLGVGAFTEHGPFRPIAGGTLVKNKYSWNKVANILYLESPAEVGFSYSKNTTFSTNDTFTAQDNLMFLHNWLDNFPEYKTRDFYITGESYAGHYVPQFAHLIFQLGSKFNLKGILIGNPLLNFATDFNSKGLFYWSHGLVSDHTYELLATTCNMSQLLKEVYLSTNLSAPCSVIEKKLLMEISNSIDDYDVTADVCVRSGESQTGLFANPLAKSRSPLLRSLQAVQLSVTTQSESTQIVDPCLFDKVFEYLNRKDVQEALHAQLVRGGNWSFCSRTLSYDFTNLLISTADLVGSLVSSGFRVLVFSGDQDSVVPFIGSRTLIKDLAKELKLNTTVPYRAWFDEKQVGGWTEVYGDILTYATIRGASHMAPYSSPGRSLALFKAFIAGKPLPDSRI